MPTPPPPPVAEPKDEIEEAARAGAVAFTLAFLGGLESYAYANRSYLPDGVDCTEFLGALGKVRKFCQSRPDWTLNVYLYSQKEYHSDHEAVMELKRLRRVVDTFEAESGLKLDREYPNKNSELAEGVKAILAGREAKARALQARNEARTMVHMLEMAVANVKEALETK